MYEKVVWTHPVQRRFVTRISLDGTPLKQELSGIQRKEVLLTGATHQEYAEAVNAHAESNFVEGFSVSASPIFRHGYESFNVSVSGSRRVPPKASGGLSVEKADSAQDGSYSYLPGDAKI